MTKKGKKSKIPWGKIILIATIIGSILLIYLFMKGSAVWKAIEDMFGTISALAAFFTNLVKTCTGSFGGFMKCAGIGAAIALVGSAVLGLASKLRKGGNKVVEENENATGKSAAEQASDRVKELEPEQENIKKQLKDKGIPDDQIEKATRTVNRKIINKNTANETKEALSKMAESPDKTRQLKIAEQATVEASKVIDEDAVEDGFDNDDIDDMDDIADNIIE